MSDETTPRVPDPHAVHRGVLPLGAPSFLGRHETLRILGSGTFGRVYLAHDPEMDRYVAIKMPKEPLPPESHREFLREARIVAKLHHPNICPVYDVGVQDELPFIVMHYVSGGTLNDLIAHKPTTPTRALRFVEQIAKGLETAHACGIIHRDLKPANVLHDGTAGELLLTDFGIARLLENTAATTGGIKGTPAYMAPEQWEPDDRFGPISARTDVYSLGVILFRLLTGVPLFTGTQLQLMRQHCDAEPSRPSEVRPELDCRLDDLCLKALSKQPSDRYDSAKQFADALAAHLRNALTSNTPANFPHVSPAQVHTPPQPSPGTQGQRLQVTIPGTWYSRPAGDDQAELTEVATTPAEISIRPDEVYLLIVRSNARDTDLAGLVELQALSSLTGLSFSECGEMTDASLKHLKAVPNLQELSLRQCVRITDAGLKRLRSLTKLQYLNLSYCWQITDKGLEHLEHFSLLKSLDLSRCTQIGDAGLEHLAGLTALRSLNLSRCDKITDAGLSHLEGLLSLRVLDLSGYSKIKPTGIAALQTALPNCEIKR